MKKHFIKKHMIAVLISVLACVTIPVSGGVLADMKGESSDAGTEQGSDGIKALRADEGEETEPGDTCTISITYDAESGGTAVSEPACSGGSGKIVVNEGGSFSVTATPEENYRVSSVTKDGIEITGISGNNYIYTDTEFDIDIDHDYVIT